MAKLYRRPQHWTPALGALLLCAVATAALAAGTYGVSLFGELKYGPDFKNFDYFNPSAPKGGTMKFSAIGTYDTFNTLREKGHPRYRSYYGDVTKLEKAGERGVRFTLKSADNRELPQIIGQMPVLSKAYWSNRDFTKTTLEPP